MTLSILVLVDAASVCGRHGNMHITCGIQIWMNSLQFAQAASQHPSWPLTLAECSYTRASAISLISSQELLERIAACPGQGMGSQLVEHKLPHVLASCNHCLLHIAFGGLQNCG